MSQKKQESFFSIVSNLIERDAKGFLSLLGLVIFESLLVFGTVLAIIPMSEFLLDPDMKNPSRLTFILKNFFTSIGISPSFWVFGGFFVTVNFLKGLTEVFVAYFILKIKYKLLRQIYTDLLSSIFKAEWIFFSKIKLGSLLNSLSTELPRVGDTVGHITSLIAQILQLIIYISIPLYINFKMTIIVLLFFLSFFIFLRILNKISYSLGKQNTQTANKTLSFLTEAISSLKLIFSYSKQANTKSAYFKLFDKHVDITLRSQVLSIIITKIFLPLLMLGVVISVGYSLSTGIVFSEAVAVMWSLLLSLPVCISIFQLSVSFKNFVNSFEQIKNIMKEAKKHPLKLSNLTVKKFDKQMMLKNVYFSYPGRNSTLRNVNLSIKKNKITALVGSSGSGKSTILDLVMGLQKPLKGKIYIDEKDISTINLEKYRNIIGIVPQEPFLLEISIKDNLLWGLQENHSVTEQHVWKALKLAKADDFIKKLPKGINTIVGSRGNSLSGGQKQRVALARALIRKPEILILDEATSSLDEKSEQIIINALKKISKKTTILIVTHKISLLKNVDTVYVVENGKVKKSINRNLIIKL